MPSSVFVQTLSQSDVSNIIQTYSGTVSHTHVLSQITGLLDGNGKINSSLMPQIAINQVFNVTTIGQMNSLTTMNTGDICNVNNGQWYIYNGSAWVEFSIFPEIDNISTLGDVTLTSLSNGQYLQYDSTAGKWKNVTLNITSALSSLTDCTITSPSTNQILKYNGSAWINSTISLNNLSNASIASPTAGNFLYFNNVNWVNKNVYINDITDFNISFPSANQVMQYVGNKWTNQTLSLITSYASLTDVVLSGLANNQVMIYNSSTSKWNNSNVSLSMNSDVNISAPSNNQVLTYNAASSKWINQTVSAGASSLSALTDATITSPATQQYLTYNGSKWVNQLIPQSDITGLSSALTGINNTIGNIQTTQSLSGNSLIMPIHSNGYWYYSNSDQTGNYGSSSLSGFTVLNMSSQPAGLSFVGTSTEMPNGNSLNNGNAYYTVYKTIINNITSPSVFTFKFSIQEAGVLFINGFRIFNYNFLDSNTVTYNTTNSQAGHNYAISQLAQNPTYQTVSINYSLNTGDNTGVTIAPSSFTSLSNPWQTSNNVVTWVIIGSTNSYKQCFDCQISLSRPSPTALNQMSDVTITSPSTNQLLQYNGTKWINATVSSGSSTLASLTDCTITTPTNTQVLQYNGSKWVNNTLSLTTNLSGLTDVQISGLAVNNFLQYNGTKWANTVITTDNIPQGSVNMYFSSSNANILSSLNNMSNVTYSISSLTANQTVTPVYTDEATRPIMMMYTPNTAYGLLPTGTMVYGYSNALYNVSASSLFTLVTDGLDSTQGQFNIYATTSWVRLNFDIITSQSANKLKYAQQWWTTSDKYAQSLTLYASNDITDYNNTTTFTFSGNGSMVLNGSAIVTTSYALEIPFQLTNSYRYWCVVFHNFLSNPGNTWALKTIDIAFASIALGGTYTADYEPTNFTISTDSTTGYPSITAANTQPTSSYIMSFSNMCIFENYRRVFPVIRDNSMIISGGLITSTSTIYDTVYCPGSAFYSSSSAACTYGMLQVNLNDFFSCSIQLPRSYLNNTVIKAYLCICSGNYSTTGDFAVNYTYFIEDPLLLGNTPTLQTDSKTLSSYFGSPYYSAWVPLTDIANDATNSKRGSIVNFEFQRITTGNTSLNALPVLVKGLYLKYQVNSFGALN